MFKLFKEENELWNTIGNVKEGRENLGEEMPVFVYRLFQNTVKEELVKRFGKEVANDVYRCAGEVSGREFALHYLDLSLPFNEFSAQLQKRLEEFEMGILHIEKFDINTGAATLTISEDLDCSGLPVTGETVCNYDEGFLAGVLKEYTKKDYSVIEVDCWATGSRVCRFEANVKGEQND